MIISNSFIGWHNKAGVFDWEIADADGIGLILVDNLYAFSHNDDFLDDVVGFEITLSGYTRQNVGTRSVTRTDASNRVNLLAADTVFAALGGSPQETVGGGIMHMKGASDAARRIIGFLDNPDFLSNSQSVTFQYNAGGVDGAVMIWRTAAA